MDPGDIGCRGDSGVRPKNPVNYDRSYLPKGFMEPAWSQKEELVILSAVQGPTHGYASVEAFATEPSTSIIGHKLIYRPAPEGAASLRVQDSVWVPLRRVPEHKQDMRGFYGC